MKRLITPENNINLAIELRRGRWLVHDIESLIPTAISLLDRQDFLLQNTEREFEPMMFDSDSRAVSASEATASNQCVVVIPICGTITKYDTCGTIGTTTYAKSIIEAADNSNVIAVVLDIDSGGGDASAVPIITEAIKRFKLSKKPIIAHADFCASAAYWIASQCDAIYCDNAITSELGSIGAYCFFIDNRPKIEKDGCKIHEIYADESCDKNIAYRQALTGKYDIIKRNLSHLIAGFHGDVKAGRPALKVDAAGVLSGNVFFAADAIENGMADGIATLTDCIDKVFIRASTHF